MEMTVFGKNEAFRIVENLFSVDCFPKSVCEHADTIAFTLTFDMPKNCEIVLTYEGQKRIRSYIAELEAKRKEILDAKKDTADETHIPTMEDIISDIDNGVGIDDDGAYYNSWGVTDNYNADEPIVLIYGADFLFAKEKKNAIGESVAMENIPTESIIAELERRGFNGYLPTIHNN